MFSSPYIVDNGYCQLTCSVLQVMFPVMIVITCCCACICATCCASCICSACCAYCASTTETA